MTGAKYLELRNKECGNAMLSSAQNWQDLSMFIHLIHKLKLPDWLKKHHMTWIIFNNVHVWKLMHPF